MSGGFHYPKKLGFELYAEFSHSHPAYFYSVNKGADDIVEVLYQSQKLCELLDNQPAFEDFLFAEVYSETNQNSLLAKLDESAAVRTFLGKLPLQLDRIATQKQPDAIKQQTRKVRQAMQEGKKPEA